MNPYKLPATSYKLKMTLEITTITMAMPAKIIIADDAKEADIESVFTYWQHIDDKLSTYKKTSEISKINRGEIKPSEYSSQMKDILARCEKTKKDTNGFFNIEIDGKLDPSGIVKGYAIWQGAEILTKRGYKNFYVEIAGDIEVRGTNQEGNKWRIGLQNPFNKSEIIKVVHLSNQGIATSGNYQQGDHIWDPIHHQQAKSISSITVIGPNVYEADRMATAAFAMGKEGINFIESQEGLEGYMINNDGIATMTRGFNEYI